MVFLRVRIALVPVKNGNQELVLPIDFRRYFISLIKTMSEGSQLFKRFDQDRPGFSPYVFGVSFSKIIQIDTSADQMVVKPPVNLIVSTGLFDVMTTFCNGAIRMTDKETVLGLKVDQVQLLPLKKITSEQVIFKTFSHVVLRGPNGYLDGSNIAQMEEAINWQIQSRAKFLREEYSAEINLAEFGTVTVLPNSSYRKGVCFHYGGQLTTLQGQLVLAGPSDAMQFLYDYGIGVRGGQGFGLLEVVEQR